MQDDDMDGLNGQQPEVFRSARPALSERLGGLLPFRARRDDGAAQPPDPLLSLVDRHWRDLCRDGAPPRRVAIDPNIIAPALPHVLIAERLAPGHARLRVAGTEVADLFGMEVRGMPCSILVERSSRRTLADALDRVFDDRAVLRLTLEAIARYGQPKLAGRLTLWPLLSDTGVCDRTLGFLSVSGTPGRAPRRFDVLSVIAQEAMPMATLRAELPPRPRGGRPHLVLVKG